MIKVGYLVVREDLSSPLVNSQCLDVIERIGQSDERIDVILIWFYRIDYLKDGGRRLRAQKKNLKKRGIDSIFLPFLSWKFPVSYLLLPLVLPQWFFGLVIVGFIHNIKILHCRSYYSAILGLLCKKCFNCLYIFDPRSPFPEEQIARGRWGVNSWEYTIWKKIETQSVTEADRVVLTSPHLRNRYLVKIDNERFVFVPNNYPASYDREKSGYTQRASSHDPKTLQLLYIGSLGHWNRVEPYLQFFSELKILLKRKVRITFLTQEKNHKRIKKIACSFDLTDDEYSMKFLAQEELFEEIPHYTAGLYFMTDSDPRLGVKTVEYIRGGIPVVVSRNIQGAADLITTSNLGIVYDNTTQSLHKVADFLEDAHNNKMVWQRKCRSHAIAHYSVDSVVSKLCEMYSQLPN